MERKEIELVNSYKWYNKLKTLTLCLLHFKTLFNKA